MDKSINLSLNITNTIRLNLGLWEVIPMETPNTRIGAQNTTGFTKVYVSGEKMTFSGGPNNRTQVQTISIHRTPEGIIYLDEKGSVLTKWEPQNGVIEVKNVLGFKIMWKRETATINAPIADQPTKYGWNV